MPLLRNMPTERMMPKPKHANSECTRQRWRPHAPALPATFASCRPRNHINVWQFVQLATKIPAPMWRPIRQTPPQPVQSAQPRNGLPFDWSSRHATASIASAVRTQAVADIQRSIVNSAEQRERVLAGGCFRESQFTSRESQRIVCQSYRCEAKMTRRTRIFGNSISGTLVHILIIAKKTTNAKLKTPVRFHRNSTAYAFHLSPLGKL